MTQVMLVMFIMPAIQVAIQHVVLLSTSGRTTGTTTDSRDDVSHTAPIYGCHSASRNSERSC